MAIEDEDWPTPQGPFSGNADFLVPLRPPLKKVWEHPVTAKRGDGWRVGGRGSVVIAVRGTDFECLSLTDGGLRWSKKKAKREGQPFYLAGRRTWSDPGGPSMEGYKTLVLDLTDGAEKVVPLALVPQGLAEFAHELRFVQRDQIISLANHSIEESKFALFGRMRCGLQYAIAPFDDTMGVSCYSPSSGEFQWKLGPTQPSETPICVGEKEFVTFQSTGTMRVRSTKDGRQFWYFQSGHTFETLAPCVLSEGMLFRWEGLTLLAHSAMTGEILWELRSGKDRSNILSTPGFIWVGLELEGKGTHLAAIEKRTGSIVWSTEVQSCGGQALSLIDSSILAHIGKKVVSLAPG